jgi:HK97 family phage prohead protease
MNIEKRHIVGIEMRRTSGQSPRLVGYAAVFNSLSRVLPPGFVEVIRPGAFTRSLRERGDEIFALVDHDTGKIIGRRGKNLTLEEDQRGLRMEVVPIASSDGDDVIKNVEAGILDSMSFAFSVNGGEGVGTRWDHSTKPSRRELLDIELYEVSIVPMPAYTDTSVAVRGHEAILPRSVAQLRARLEARADGWRLDDQRERLRSSRR